MEVIKENEEGKMATYYSNVAGIECSVYDFKLMFGVKKDAKTKVGKDDWDVGIYMSPQHAKAIVDILNANIEKYEKTFGKINMKGLSFQTETVKVAEKATQNVEKSAENAEDEVASSKAE